MLKYIRKKQSFQSRALHPLLDHNWIYRRKFTSLFHLGRSILSPHIVQWTTVGDYTSELTKLKGDFKQ